MARMQSAHGGNEADDAILCARLARDLLHPRYGADYFHGIGKKRKPLRKLPRWECASYCAASCLGLRCGAFAIKDDQVGGDGFGIELAQHGCDLAAMISAVIAEVLQNLPKGSRLRRARRCFVGNDAF